MFTTTSGRLLRSPAIAAVFYKVLLSVLFPTEWKQSSEEGTWKTTCSVGGGEKTLQSGSRMVKIPRRVGCSLKKKEGGGC